MIATLDRHLRRIADAYAADGRFLAALRIAFGVWVIAFPVDVRWVAEVPAAFVNPRPGLFIWLSAPPSEPALIGLMIAKAVCGVLVAMGLWTLPASLALSAGMVVSSGILYSYSKVDHFILAAIAPVFLAFAGWGGTWSVDALRRRRRGRIPQVVRGLPILLFAMTVGWGMFTAAVPKARGGWLNPQRHATRGYIARDIAQDEHLGLLGERLLEIDTGAFWKFLDYATLVTEAGLVFLVFLPLLYRSWLVAVVGFHVGVYLALGINFTVNLLAYAVFFSPAVMWVARRIHAAWFAAPEPSASVEVVDGGERSSSVLARAREYQQPPI